ADGYANCRSGGEDSDGESGITAPRDRGMVIGMATTVKITVTIPKKQLEEIRALVKNRRTDSVSGFVKHAIGVSLEDTKDFREMMDEWLMETGGPLTKEERGWADSVLNAPFPKRSARKKRKAA